MKVRITESELKQMIKQVMRESMDDEYNDKALKAIKQEALQLYYTIKDASHSNAYNQVLKQVLTKYAEFLNFLDNIPSYSSVKDAFQDAQENGVASF